MKKNGSQMCGPQTTFPERVITAIHAVVFAQGVVLPVHEQEGTDLNEVVSTVPKQESTNPEMLLAILEEHFPSVDAEQKAETKPVDKEPIEGKWFEVIPEAINQRLFYYKRNDPIQEATRLFILEGFAEMADNPEYARPFESLIPNVSEHLHAVMVKDILEMAKHLGGDHNMNWVEFALELAQRIHNGNGSEKVWDDLCNKPDTVKWFALVAWKNRLARVVGGCRKIYNHLPAARIGKEYSKFDKVRNALPKPVRYKN